MTVILNMQHIVAQHYVLGIGTKPSDVNRSMTVIPQKQHIVAQHYV